MPRPFPTRLLIFALSVILTASAASAQVSLTTLGTPTPVETFDTLATSGTANPWADNTTLPGWYAQFSATPANPTTYRADNTNTGAIYSYGIAGTNPLSDRAFGSVSSGTPVEVLRAVRLVNNTGATLTSLVVSFTGEQWRQGGCAPTPCTPVAQTLDFQYQVANAGVITDANTPSTGWVDHNALDFTTPQPGTSTATALDGNASANRTALSSTITVTVNAGQEIWLRWRDINDPNNDHSFGTDDFSVTPQGAPPLPTLTVNDVSAAETNAGTTTFTFTVSLNTTTHGGVTFDIATADGTAQDDNPVSEDSDYVANSLTGQTIPNGSNSYQFNVTVNGDAIPETNETFFVNVTNVTGATVSDGQGQGTITNDDSATLNVGDVTQLETNGATTFAFSVSLTQPAPPGGVTFDITTANDTATTADNDYVASTLTGQTIPAGSTSTTFNVTVNGDTNIEPTESFFVNVSNITNATPGDVQGLGTIQTDDFGLSINDAAPVTEGNSGTVNASFTVTLSSPAPTGGITFDIATADNTATTANNDYVAKSLTAQTIAAGQTTYPFTVVVNGDTAIEATETFFVNLANPSAGVQLTDSQGTGTITNDDNPSLTINDAAVVEGNAGTQTLTFTVTISPTPIAQVTVDYATADNSATIAGNDYVATSGQLTFNPGDTTKTFDVTVNGDTTSEGNEQFFVNLSNPTGGAVIGDSQALGIIRMDDPRGIAAVDTPVIETFDTLAQSGLAATTPVGWTFVETGSNANNTYSADTGSSNAGNTYSYGAAGNSERAFGGIQSGSVTVLPTIGAFFRNDTPATITTLTINYTGEQWRLGTTGRQDRLDFQYSLDATSLSTGTWTDFDALDFLTPNTTTTGAKDGNAVGNRTPLQATIVGLNIAPGATFWIRYNDFNASSSDDGLAVDDFSLVANITGAITINDVSIIEGNAGTQILTFTITRSDPPTEGGSTIDYTTADNTATTADNDYLPTSGTATIPMGQTTTTVNVTINGDTNQEPTETFFVNLTGATNGTILDNQGVGSILADDFTFTLISAVQGSGNQSPLAGSTVTVGGIVTGIKQGGSGGFFVQEEVADYDSDPNTSEGIFVFTAGAIPAGVAIGNRVAVTGTVAEFPSSSAPHTVTELTSATVSLMATGQPLPAPMSLTSGDGAPTTNLSQYERYEGMRVAVTLEVTAPTSGSKDETNATGSSNGVFYGVVQGNPRAFREPGIPVNDVVPSEAPCAACIPRFDRNPERIRVASTSQPGATQLNVAVGQVVSNLVGPLDYGFLEYTILPEAATVPVVTGSSTFVAVPAPLAAELTVASINLERFYDNVDDPAVDDALLTATAYTNRLNKASLAIRNVLRSPDVVGVVEMENLTVLQALAAKINADSAGATNYVAYLSEGNDQGGIDVGFLVNQNRVTVNSVTQIGKTDTFVDPSDSSVDILHDRPPLVLDATAQRTDATPYNFIVIVNHLRSLNGNEEDSGTGLRVREKRRKQAEYLANYIQSLQTANPQTRIITVGDFNAFQFNDGFVDLIGIIKGTPAPSNEVVEPSSDLVNPDLVNLVDLITAAERYSYVFGGNLQVLDHAIVNQAMYSTYTRAAFGHFDAGFPEIFRSDATRPERVSDHDGIVAYFDLSPAGALAFSAANYDVGEATTTFNVTVNRTGGSAGAVSATYTVAAGTATAGADFTAATGTISFANGETSKTFPVTIINDAIYEPSQTISLTLSAPVGGATLGAQSTATITILDNDAAPVFTISDVSIAEGNSGATNAQLTVTLTGASEFTSTVNWATADGTATAAGSDYTTSGAMLTFVGPGSQTINIPILGDTTDETDETVLVNLTGATNATVGDAQGVVTIVDDDGAPSLLINDISVTEGNSGTQQASLTVTLVGSTSQEVTFNWTMTAGTAMCCGVDFSGPDGSMTFTPGQTTKTISATIFGETIFETNETVLVNLTSATNATISDNQGVITIVNDDAPPVFTISDINFTEGNAGTTNAMVTVTLSGMTALSATVDYATANGTATAGSDYTTTTGTLTFNPGTTTQQIAIPILGDSVIEANETVLVNLTNPANATISDNQGVVTISNDDGTATIAINDSSVAEGNSGTANGMLTVTLTGNTAQTVTVNYTTANGTATAGSDYTATSGTLTFPPGTTTQQIAIPVLGDSVIEANETVLVNLTNPANATISDNQGVLTITNDDGTVTLAINDTSVTEGNSGSVNATFTVTLTGNTAQTVTVDYATANGTATAGSDYTTNTGTLTFNPGTTTQQIVVPVLGDTALEPTETFVVNLTNPTNATIADNQGTGTINDNDGFGVADLVVTVTQAPIPARGGEPVTITILLTNNGPASATNVVVTDQIGAGLTLLSASSTQGTCTGTTTVTCSLGTILAGANATVTLRLQVPTAGGTFNHTVSAVSAESDPTPVSQTFPIVTDAHVAIPTLSEWALIALAMMLAAFAALRLRA